jgi:hypothetical protein
MANLSHILPSGMIKRSLAYALPARYPTPHAIESCTRGMQPPPTRSIVHKSDGVSDATSSNRATADTRSATRLAGGGSTCKRTGRPIATRTLLHQVGHQDATDPGLKRRIRNVAQDLGPEMHWLPLLVSMVRYGMMTSTCVLLLS